SDELDWFENLLEEEDVDVIAWVFATADVPERFAGPMMDRMRKLDYVSIPR
ncbi:MAG: succinate dehydrogenase assembly factor 2, partial [Sphingomonadaceae bacterium]